MAEIIRHFINEIGCILAMYARVLDVAGTLVVGIFETQTIIQVLAERPRHERVCEGLEVVFQLLCDGSPVHVVPIL